MNQKTSLKQHVKSSRYALHTLYLKSSHVDVRNFWYLIFTIFIFIFIVVVIFIVVIISFSSSFAFSTFSTFSTFFISLIELTIKYLRREKLRSILEDREFTMCRAFKSLLTSSLRRRQKLRYFDSFFIECISRTILDFDDEELSNAETIIDKFWIIWIRYKCCRE